MPYNNVILIPSEEVEGEESPTAVRSFGFAASNAALPQDDKNTYYEK